MKKIYFKIQLSHFKTINRNHSAGYRKLQRPSSRKKWYEIADRVIEIIITIIKIVEFVMLVANWFRNIILFHFF